MINQERFDSMKRCAAATGTPIDLLKAAKNSGAPGFSDNGRINWTELGPYIEENRGRLSQKESPDSLKAEKTKKEIELLTLKIKQMESDLIEPEEVNTFMSSFAVILSTALKQKRNELVSKCNGFEAIIDADFKSIFTVIEREINKWKDEHEIPS